MTKKFFNFRYEIHAIPIIENILESLLEFNDLRYKLGLDVGCGWGWFIHFAEEKVIDIYGFDINLKLLKEALTFGVRYNRLLISDGQYMPFRDNIFEFIFCWHVLEHIPNPQKTLREITRVLKAKGVFILGVPNESSITNFLFKVFRWLFHKGIEHNLIKKIAFYDSTHIREYKLSSIINMLKNDFYIMKIHFDFLTLPIFRILKILRFPSPKTSTLINIGNHMPPFFNRSIEVYAKKKLISNLIPNSTLKST